MIKCNITKDDLGNTIVETKGHALKEVCSAVTILNFAYAATGGKLDIIEDGHTIAIIPPYPIDEELHNYGTVLVTGLVLLSKDERYTEEFELSSEKEEV